MAARVSNDRGYPPCANPKCDYTLCWMERRDWDECPACGHLIPPHLRVDINFKPIVTI